MADVKIVRYLLVHNAALAAIVPEERIVAGRLPEGIGLPAIAISHISTVRGVDGALGASRLRRARVQVTVTAESYPQQKTVFGLVVDALPTVRNKIAGVDVDSIVPVLEGPDFGDDDVGLFQQSYDVMVTYSL